VVLLAPGLDERGENTLTMLGDAIVEFLKGPKILPRIFETVDEVEVGLPRLLMQNIAVVLDLILLM
jgi:hypothetical protein